MPKGHFSEEITGMRSGNLTVIRQSDVIRRRCRLWECRCDCGNTILTEAFNIRNGKVRSCGCIRIKKLKQLQEREDLTGKRFGLLTVSNATEGREYGHILWHCRCDCGGEIDVPTTSLKSGNTQSCGCLLRNKPGPNLEYVENTCVNFIESGTVFKNNTSGYRGVSWDKSHSSWCSYITFQKKKHFLGRFSRLEDAVKVRKSAEERLFGEFLDRYHNR